MALITLSDRPGTADDGAAPHARTLSCVCVTIKKKKKKKKSARWHVYKSHFMPACVFAHVRRRRLIAAISDYLGSLVGSLVATATPALLTLKQTPRETRRASERASEPLWVLLGRCRSGWECGCSGRL